MEAILSLKCPANGETKQRHICRGYSWRYTLPTSLNYISTNSQSTQIGTKVKNLDSAQEPKACVGDVRKLSPEIQGLIAKFCSYLEINAYSEANHYPRLIKQLAALNAKLDEPEQVKETISKMTYVNRQSETVKVSNGTKMLYCAAYGAFAKMLKIQWDNPGYTQEEKEVYVPYEAELDALITGTHSRRMAAYLQTLKETFADPSEALRIRWIDIDEKNSVIKINFPVKNHNSGSMQVSAKLLSMLSSLPHTKERVFPVRYSSLSATYRKYRKRIASIQQNPRIEAVELRGFRHWGGTMIAYNTNGNVLEVKRLLRHKNIKSTMKYIGKINFKNDDFQTTSASTVDEVLKLGGEGWTEYSVVTINGVEVHCFKKPKQFRSA
jgi:integrase